MALESVGVIARKAPILSVIVPCFNEEEVLEECASRLKTVVLDLKADKQVAEGSHIVFVDDGSSDRTWVVIEKLANSNDFFRGIKLARNFGHQNAILSGLLSVDGEVTITIDADLQDPPEVIGQMIECYRSGADIVYGIRNDRTSDSRFKRATANAYYRLLRLMGVELVADHADYRLVSRIAVEALRKYDEVNLFLRGLVPLLGFRQESVFYRREKRLAGSSKYGLVKMLALGVNGITSFTVFPLRLITFLGLLFSLFAIGASIWAIVAWLINAALPGWTSIVLPMYLLGGVQLLSIGIVGEYLGKNYLETKRRPLYLIEKTLMPR